MNTELNQNIGLSVASEFPSEALPKAIRDIVLAVTASRQVPVLIPASAALATVAAALGRGIAVKSGSDRRTLGNLYLCITAPSGTGKSSIELLTRPLQDLEDIARFRRTLAKDDSPVSLRSVLSNGEHEHPEAVKQSVKSRDLPHPIFMSSEATGPGLEMILRTNNEVTFNVSAEAGGILLAISRTNTRLETLFLKGFTNERYLNFNARSTVELVQPCITALLLTQPSRLKQFFADPRLIEGGLAGRMLVAQAEGGMQPIREGLPAIPEKVRDAYEQLIWDIFNAYYHCPRDQPPWEVTVETEAGLIINQFQRETAGQYQVTKDPLARTLMARWPEMVWRVALVLHVAEHGSKAHRTQLRPETANQAVKLVRWFGAQAKAILRVESEQERRFKRLLQILQDSPEGEVKERDLKNSHNFSLLELDACLAQYPGIIERGIRQNPNGGPRSTSIRLKADFMGDVAA